MFGEAAADESVFVGAGRSEMARPGKIQAEIQPFCHEHFRSPTEKLRDWKKFFIVFPGSRDVAAATFWKSQGSLGLQQPAATCAVGSWRRDIPRLNESSS